MTNVEIRMSKEFRSTNAQNSSFVLWISFVIRHYSFVIFSAARRLLPAACLLLLLLPTALCLLPTSLPAGEPRELLLSDKAAYEAQWVGAARNWQWQFETAAGESAGKPQAGCRSRRR